MTSTILIDCLIGQTIFHITHDAHEIELYLTDGTCLVMHDPERGSGNDVEIVLEDINGDLQDLYDQPIVLAEEVSNMDDLPDKSGTWTFYRMATPKGFVVLRWLGNSNGYYAEKITLGWRGIDVHDYPQYAEHLARVQKTAITEAVGARGAVGGSRKM